MDCTGIADASTEFEFKIVEFSPMVTAYLFEAGRDYYYIGKFARFLTFRTISRNSQRFSTKFALEWYKKYMMHMALLLPILYSIYNI